MASGPISSYAADLIGHGAEIMNTPRRPYVLNLPEWELPRLDGLEFELVEELAAAARAKRIDRESLEDVFSELLHQRLLKFVEPAVNEAIEYWLKGLGDGNNGDSARAECRAPVSGASRNHRTPHPHLLRHQRR